MTTKEMKRRHQMGREGEAIIARLTNGIKTSHKAPFDVVDFSAGVAYEVKSMSAFSRDLKIHIADSSYERKLEFAKKYGLKMILFAVVILDSENVEVYSGELRQSIRINQMSKIK